VDVDRAGQDPILVVESADFPDAPTIAKRTTESFVYDRPAQFSISKKFEEDS